MNRTSVAVAILLAALFCAAYADPLPQLDYQGKVLVNDLPFNGSGYFKFALMNAGGTNVWSNDSTAVGEPNAYLSLTVVNGVFSVVLGQQPLMTNPIPVSVFAPGTGLWLRVWFSSSATGFAELVPAQRLVSAAYALNAHLVDGYHAADLIAAATNGVLLAGDVAGPPANNHIQPNAVTAAEIAPNAVGTSEIADGSVASIDILDGTITSVDVATDTLGAANIAPNAVGSSELVDGAIMDVDVNASAVIAGTKIAQGTTAVRGTVQLASGSTGPFVIGTGHPSLNAYGAVNTLTAGAPNSALTLAGAGGVYVSNVPPSTVLIGMAALSGASISNLDPVIWVATNGTAAGPGTIERPYDTPQNGYNAAAARFTSTPATLVIAGGSYPGGLDLNAGNVHVQGLARPEINELRAAMPLSSFMQGKVRVEGLVVTGKMVRILFTNVSGVKFRNVKMLEGLWLMGHNIELEHCYITQRTEPQFGALRIGDGASQVTTVSVHHCAVEVADANLPAVKVEPNVQELEVLWCELVNRGGGPAIDDAEPGPVAPLHLYAHNWIKGPAPLAPSTALRDVQVTQGPTIAFYHNTVFGNVGFANGGVPHRQYYANNLVHGVINWPGAGAVGWLQAGAGSGADAANNTEFQTEYPALPDAWND